MTTATPSSPTARRRAAAQAYLRLLQTVRAVLDTTGPATGTGADQPPPAAVPPALLEEADRALAAAGLTGRESEFFALLRAYRPGAQTPAR